MESLQPAEELPYHRGSSSTRIAQTQVIDNESSAASHQAGTTLNLPSRNPFQGAANGHASDFNNLTHFERRLYLLQAGAPADGNTLPRTWQQVKENLYNYGVITVNSFSSENEKDWIKEYYGEIQKGIESYWNCEPEPKDNGGWTFYRLEDFEVFDVKRGQKYWKHHKNSVVSPMSNEPDFVELFEVAEDEDEELNGDMDGATTQNEMGLGESKVAIPPPSFNELPFSILEDDASLTIDGNDEENEVSLQREAEQSSFENLQDQVRHSGSELNLEDIAEWLKLPEPAQTEDAMNPPSASQDIITHSGPLESHYQHIRSPSLFEPYKASQAPLPKAFPSSANTLLPSTAKLFCRAAQSQKDQQVTASKKRKTRSEIEVRIHEDSRGRTQESLNVTTINPRSLGIDLPKENLDEAASAGNYRTLFGPIHTPRGTRIHHVGNMSAPPPSRRSLFYGPNGHLRTSPASAAG